jgi:hypothetical protein
VGAEDEFPGKDPLYDFLVAALDHIEREPERHIRERESHIKREGEASTGHLEDDLKGRIQVLESLLLQRDSVIRSKDVLLGIKEETLVANKEFMAEKDRFLQAWLSNSTMTS